MNVAVELPEDIARRLATEWDDLPRRALEAIAVEGYRTQVLTQAEVGRILNLSWHETETFLKERQAYLHYDGSDLEQDRATLSELTSK
jgi:predicted HTH domain antitoxin